MILYPALELRNPADAAPLAEQANHFAGLGFERLYIIDREAQFQGKPFNMAAVKDIITHTRLPVWTGGGIRDVVTAKALMQAGAERVIVGPMFWQQPGLLTEITQAFPGKIIVLIDALSGIVTHDSVASPSKQQVLDLALEFERVGASGILYMEHEREGVMGTLDTEAISDLAFALTIPLYVTGGINSMSDLRALKAESSTGIAGVVLGRALLDGRIDPITALALLKSENKELS